MLIKQFNKGYFTYFIGIIIPASVSFLIIPLLKNTLGTSNFGIYTFYASILIIINASFSGGISQSIMRLQGDFTEKSTFYHESLSITFLTALLICIPVFFYIQLNYHDLRFSLLFIITLIAANFYASLLAITQASFLSAGSAISESIRSIIFIGLSLLLVRFLSYNYLFLLFISLLASYGIGSVFLFIKNKLSFSNLKLELKKLYDTGQQMLKYGGYLIGWFFCTYGLTMSSRFVLAAQYGKENIGHFTASFDILNKSIIFLLSPVLLALFPLVIKAFSEGEHAEVALLIKRLILLEVAAMCLVLLAFYFVGFSLLSKILKTPQTLEYLLVDLEVIGSTFVWQLAMLQHKYLELHKKTGKMLLAIFIAFIVSVNTDFMAISYGGLRCAGIGFLLSGIVYFVLVLFYGRRSKQLILNS